MLRVFTKNPYYKIDHYFDMGIENAGWHQHPFYEIFYFISGTVQYVLGDQKIKICPGDILFVDKNTMHYPIIVGQKTYNRYVLRVSPELVEQFNSKQTNLSLCFHATDEHTLILRPDAETHKMVLELIRILLELEGETSYGADVQQKIHIIQLMLLLNTVEQRINLRVKMVAQKHLPLLQSIKDYIQQNLSGELSLDGIANYFFISKYYLCHLFHDKEKQTVYDYICAQRVALAKPMIMKGISLAQVASQCGFHAYDSFYRAFRDREGISPRAYYRQVREQQSVEENAASCE